MNAFLIVISLVLGYILGSIEWTILLAKYILKKDISKLNIEYLDTIKTIDFLGLPLGILSLLLSFLKSLFIMFVISKITTSIYPIAFAGLATCIGNSFSFLLKINGGKSAPTFFGFLLGFGLFVLNDITFVFIFPLLIFMIVLGLSKFTSLSSVVSILASIIITFLVTENETVLYALIIIFLIIVYNYRRNIYRIVIGKEEKIKYIK